MKKNSIEFHLGDLTEMNVEAIVNAANERLVPGAGLDAVIHRKAGPNLERECLRLGGCKAGSVKMTRGYNLKAKYVIHAVSPNYGEDNHEALLRSCYTEAMVVAVKQGIKSIAFPAIGTGICGYSKLEASSIATEAIIGFLNKHPEVDLNVIFVAFDRSTRFIYEAAYKKTLQHE